MRKIFIAGLVFGFLALGFLPRTVSAQAKVVTIEIPFDFMVGDTSLPAGTYQITKVSEGNYRIANTKSDQTAMFLTESTTDPTPAPSFTLIFNVYGDTYYFAKFFHQGKTEGDALRQTSAEKEMAKKIKPTTKAVYEKKS